jgi:glucose-6-phosphate 1-dehydrogenase
MAQNILIFRGNNPLFKHTWNRDFIEAIEIISTESIDIEGRSVLFEQTGALREFMQSHLLQLAALTLIELPASRKLSDIPAARLKALKQLRAPADVTTRTVRGQYDGYQKEVNNPGSTVETFASVTLHSSDPNWHDVPITLTTGKALNQKLTEIRLSYREHDTEEANMLVLRIQPNEGIEVDVWAKQPGFEKKLQKLPLVFSYARHFDSLPAAYEHVFIDALKGDHTLFTSNAEVIESWRILEPVQQAWGFGQVELKIYKKGSKPEAIS